MTGSANRWLSATVGQPLPLDGAVPARSSQKRAPVARRPRRHADHRTGHRSAAPRRQAPPRL